jgi:wobble nucleotide-excising tRNase
MFGQAVVDDPICLYDTCRLSHVYVFHVEFSILRVNAQTSNIGGNQ